MIFSVLGLKVKSWTLSADAAETEADRVESPGYWASTLYEPPGIVVLAKVAVPEEVVAVPRVDPEVVSMKVTVSPLGGAGATVAVKVTFVPAVTVAPGEIARVVVVGGRACQPVTKL